MGWEFHRSAAAPGRSNGGYVKEEELDENSAQFDVSDRRSLDEVVDWLLRLGYVPSFCTACYREGRTGNRFMTLLKSGQISNCCHPNALMTLKRISGGLCIRGDKKAGGEALIGKELANIPNSTVRQRAAEYIGQIEEVGGISRF